MKAVILGAGVGSRLRPITNEIPKPLLKIKKDITLLDYQLSILTELAKLKEDDICLVVGYQADKIEKHVKDKDVTIIYNEYYKKYNNMYSLYLAIDDFVGKNSFYLFNGDTYISSQILERFFKSMSKNSLFLIDSFKKLNDEEMKVLINSGKIIKFGKDIDPKDANGEYIGICKIEKKDVSKLYEALDDDISKGNTNFWYELTFNKITDKTVFEPFYIEKGTKWIEVDTLEDYDILLKLISKEKFI